MKDELEFISHYGIKRRSGRYPWGSGKEPFQHSGDFLARVEEYKRSGMTQSEIAKKMEMPTTKFRVQYSLAINERRAEKVSRAQKLRAKGYSLETIAEMMGEKGESTIRSYLNADSKERMEEAKTLASFLKSKVDEKGMIDVGAGQDAKLNVSKEKMQQALYILETEGYEVHGGRMPQMTNHNNQTTLKVLCPPGTEHKEIFQYDKINSIDDYTTHDGGITFEGMKYPSSLDSKRIAVRYAEQGGKEKDGLVEIRPGVKDLDLGDSHYAQVRILVDGTHYVKGMAVYSDNIPDGKDIVFNTNKSESVPLISEDPKAKTVLKPIKNDPVNPFGALIPSQGQSYYDDPNGEFTNELTGKKQSLNKLNKKSAEGDWDEWSKSLPSQFLAKQNYDLAKKQLDLANAKSKDEYDEIMSLTDPIIKKYYLSDFSNNMDAAAVSLKAASLPRQRYQVIVPVPSLKDNECYAPNYQEGETLALIRFPHGGTFEIPIVKVNNSNKEAMGMMSASAKDAIGINAKVAEKLSGADFDGDTVLAIPCNSPSSSIKISSKRTLKGLEGFDPKEQYPERKGMPLMKDTQKQMGVISNLITDMTIFGASEDELARAVKHSMVVIDAEKHKLNYKQSEIDNDINGLKQKYQAHVNEKGNVVYGASTLLSRAKSDRRIPKTIGSPKIDPETGELIWKTDPNSTYVDYKTGKTKTRTKSSTAMAEAKDAMTLVSNAREPMELLYANYANQCKSLANQARKSILATKDIPRDPKAAQAYQDEVESLMNKLKIAQANKPVEREAQRIAYKIKQKRLEGVEEKLSNKELTKLESEAIRDARLITGSSSKYTRIRINDKEWEAIKNHAVSPNVVKQILANSDPDVLRQYARPTEKKTLSQSKINRIKAMSDSSYTNAEIAEELGISTETVRKYL